MMTLEEEIRHRVMSKGSLAKVGANYQLLAKRFLEIGYSASVKTKGVIKTTMRFEKNGQEPFSAILNKNSILFYFRNPAFKTLKIDFSKTKARFSEVNENKAGELTLRIEDPAHINEIVDWILTY